MRNFSFIIGLVLLINVVSAQNYVPLLDTNRVWSLYTEYPHGGGYTIMHQKIGGDTIINGETYRRVLYKMIVPYIGNWTYWNFFLRETGNGEVFKKWGVGTEDLVFDFSLNEGDYFYTGGSIGGQPLYAEVVAVDSILINSSHRKRIIFDDWFDEIWIEGIGSSVSPFTPFENIYTTTYNYLICVHEFGSLAYQNPESGYSCSIVGICETEIPDGFKLYPNPAQEFIIIELEDGVNEKFEVVIFNAQGVEARIDNFTGNKFILSGEGLPRGLYFVVIHSDRQSFTKKVVFH